MPYTFCQICLHPSPDHYPGCPVATGAPVQSSSCVELDGGRIDGLTLKMMEAIRDNYLQGPESEHRVYEALNALAITAAWTLRGCDDPAALEWFSHALNTNLVKKPL